MKLRTLVADRYRSLRHENVEFGDLNLFIGANASGKSTVLDALRFLSEGVRARDFRNPVHARGGVAHLAWKGEEAKRVGLSVSLEDGGRRFEWSVSLVRSGFEFHVEEYVEEERDGRPRGRILSVDRGDGWWRSGKEGKVTLKRSPTACALAAAAADAYFPARYIASFIERWGFFEPNPFLLRCDWPGLTSDGIDPYGRNLGETLYALDDDALARVVGATRAIVGSPESIRPRKSEAEDRCYFAQDEPGLRYPVHQMGVSSGTLHMLALMTALIVEPETNLIGIEEPENNIHPSALEPFAEQLQRVRDNVQVVVTTHSPLLLNFLDDPGAVRIVRRGSNEGTVVGSDNAAAVRCALDRSGLRLGQYYETMGFGMF